MMVLSQDLPILLTLFGAATAAIIAGSLLLPRGQIMVSEASSHAVLPGMCWGFSSLASMAGSCSSAP